LKGTLISPERGVVCGRGWYKIKKGSFLNLKISWKIRGQHHLPPLCQNTPRGKGGDVGVPEGGLPSMGEVLYINVHKVPLSPYGLYIYGSDVFHTTNIVIIYYNVKFNTIKKGIIFFVSLNR
jgi:hypothetical protein